MTRIALFTGSFDPITNGHLDIVRQACRVADRIVVAIGVHSSKVPLLSVEARAELIQAVCAPVVEAAGRALASSPSTIWRSRRPDGMGPR